MNLFSKSNHSVFGMQVATSLLEDEMRDLERQIEEAKDSLKATQAEQKDTTDELNATRKRQSLTNELSSSRPLAHSSQKDFLSLKGLHCWYPRSLQESSFSFVFLGLSRNTSTLVSFDVSNPDAVKATTSPNTIRQMKRKTRIHHASISSFLTERMTQATRSLEKSRIDSPLEIGPLLQKLEWTIGRLDQTADEVENLRRRYQAQLVRDFTISANLILSAVFSNADAKLEASFEMLSYPSSPLDVRFDVLEGTVDLDALRKLLVKNAKPGFGNLSRTCDVIAAFFGY
jgi:hypothetical protein